MLFQSHKRIVKIQNSLYNGSKHLVQALLIQSWKLAHVYLNLHNI